MSTASLLHVFALKWLDLWIDHQAGAVHAHVRHGKYTDDFEMGQDDVGVNYSLLLKEAYFRRAQLMVVEKIAKELK